MERKRLPPKEDGRKNNGGARKGSGRKPGSVQLGSSDERAAFGRLCRNLRDWALKGIKDLCEDLETPATVRLAGYTAVLDRGYGKPPQAMEVYGMDDTPSFSLKITQEVLDQMNAKEVEAILKAAELAERGSGAMPSKPGSQEGDAGRFAATVGYSGQG